ncbi:MAG: hypothetical protein IPM88_14340 [Nitrospira sp.]|nr:hypothetical protein [Nitrospira sp.]
MGAIGVIALNAFRESLRDKILYNLVLFAGLLIGLSVLLADLSITEHHKVITDMGLAAINLIGVIIAIFVGISLVNRKSNGARSTRSWPGRSAERFLF